MHLTHVSTKCNNICSDLSLAYEFRVSKRMSRTLAIARLRQKIACQVCDSSQSQSTLRCAPTPRMFC
ncbi:hypothetical protein Plhal304r1_c006g0024691 [Plasmopara halstedii]